MTDGQGGPRLPLQAARPGTGDSSLAGVAGVRAYLPSALVLLITLLAFELRVVGLELESLWFDTAHSGVVALNPTVGEVLQAAAVDFQSPLYFVLVHGWLAIAQRDFWLAFPSVAAGTLIVPLAFALGRRLFEPSAGVAAALVCATTTYQVYYSRYPRGYILLAFLALLAAYWLHRALVPAHRATVAGLPGPNSGGGRAASAAPWVGHGLAVACALYTQPYAFFIVAAMWTAGGLYALFQRPARLVPLIATAVLVVAAYLPWLAVTWGQITGVRAGADAWIEPVSRDSLKTLWDWLWFKTRAEYNLPVDLLLRAARYLFTGLMAVVGLAWWRGFNLQYVVALTLGPVVLAFGFSATVVTLWDARYLVSMSPFFALWVGAAVAGTPGLVGGAVRWWRGRAASGDRASVGSFPVAGSHPLPNPPPQGGGDHHTPPPARAFQAGQPSPVPAGAFSPWERAGVTMGLLLLLAMAVPPLWSLYADPAYRVADVRGAMGFVHRQYAPGDTILHTNYQSYLPALWYDHQDPAQGDGPFPAPCVWQSLPDGWCAGSPYREAYVNIGLTPFCQGVQEVQSGWLVVLYNHNKPGDAEAQLAAARSQAEGSFTVAEAYQTTGVRVLKLQRKQA